MSHVPGGLVYKRFYNALRPANGTAPGGDPLFPQVLALLHFDGVNGSQTFTDDSNYNRNFTVSNAAVISTVDPIYNQCGYFDNTNTVDYIQTVDMTDMNLIVNAPYCLELGFNMGILPPNGSGVLFRLSGVGQPQLIWVEVTDVGTLLINLENGLVAPAFSPVTTGTYQRIAIDFDGTNVRFFYNYVKFAESIYTGLSTVPIVMRLGTGDTAGFDACVDTRLDEFRLTAGSRYTGNGAV